MSKAFSLGFFAMAACALTISLAPGGERKRSDSVVKMKAKLDKSFHAGEPVRAKVIKIDWTDKKIGLSTRDVEPLTEAEAAQYAEAARAEESQAQETEVETETETAPAPETTPQG